MRNNLNKIFNIIGDKHVKLTKVSGLILVLLLAVALNPVSAQVKIGYVNSSAILQKFKDAIDVRKQLAELNAQWEQEAKDKQTEIQGLQEQLESQSLLLSEERKKAKAAEIQDLYLKYQQFLQTTWNPQGGQAQKKEIELLEPVYKKINEAIKKTAEEESFNYIFDTVAANILYASEDQPDLTERILAELEKGLPKSK